MIDFLTRFDTSPQFVEVLYQCHQKGLEPKIGAMCGDSEGRLFLDISSIQWVQMSISDYVDGIKFSFSDDRHWAVTEPMEWQGLDQALLEFDRVILWHSLNEDLMPDLEWFDYETGEQLEALV
jgi:hypothetical protein